ncbi:MAG: DUF1580 domain-containing protein [Gemmataceae bacterium]
MIKPGEELFPISQTPCHLPPPSRQVHPSTCFRWALKGVGRKRIRLETTKIGGRRFTSKQAIQRFLDRLNREASSNGHRSRAQARIIPQTEHALTPDACD